VAPLSAERRRRLLHRALPLLALAVAALTGGLLLGMSGRSAAEARADRFARAWERGDYRAMHRELSESARRRFPLRRFERAYRAAAATATAVSIRARSAHAEGGGRVTVPVLVRTRVFGTIAGDLELPVSDRGVEWSPAVAFPEVPPGGRLERRSRPPRRGRIVSRDGKVLAAGPAGARTSPLGPLAASIAGQLGPARSARRRERLYALGFPRRMPVGQTGLERALEPLLEGRPGGVLISGRRVLARARPRPAGAVRTTIDTRLQRAAVAALGGRLAGIAALDTRSAEVRALAGIAFSAPQPPGSTFKIVTTTAALESHAVKLSDEFAVASRAIIDGVPLENANGESCGGSFAQSFAHSCNSVFAPLGVKLGARRLVDAAERYGFNERPAIPGELPSTIPPAAAIRTPLDVGSTAIGQGRVLATPFELASIAQTVANRGVRTKPTLRAGQPGRSVRVTSRRVARTLERLMLGVVAYGTGTSAAISGVKVAGKTGTAELGNTRGPQAQGSGSENTDAWFTGFAPAGHPRIAVAAMFVRAGAGGDTAAPAVRAVMAAALGKG
jgi:penicillin-binding protein A